MMSTTLDRYAGDKAYTKLEKLSDGTYHVLWITNLTFQVAAFEDADEAWSVYREACTNA